MNKRSGKSSMVRKSFFTVLTGALVSIAAVFCCVMSAHADSALSCYRGDRETGVYMGEISGANFENAAAECNSFYADCNGECYGCYFDNELTQTVCMDNQGRKFTR